METSQSRVLTAVLRAVLIVQAVIEFRDCEVLALGGRCIGLLERL